MRSILITAMFMAGLANTAWADYEEVRELTLDPRGIDKLTVESGSGSVDVTGISGSNQIEVTATIMVPDKNEAKALKRIANDLVLVLESDRSTAVLKAYFEHGGGFFSFSDSPSVHLDIRIPEGLDLDIDDGSGSLEISNVRGDIVVDDGSGSITMVNVGGDVEIDDGSGSITIERVGGDVSINDGSGSIKIRQVTGSVTVDDGSGGIDVSDVEKDLIIVEDGSGGLKFSNISGRVEVDS